MKNFKFSGFISVIFSLILVGCGTAPFKVVTDPEQAEVFIVNSSTQEEKQLGLTPLLKTDKDLEEHLKGQNSPGGLVNIIVKKDGFKTKDLWVPINAGGNLGTQLVLKLDPTTSSADELKTAQDLLQKLFLSQQFAKSSQLERALIEIDKILEVFPKFDRALSMKAAIHYAKGEFEESLKWYENALAVNPELKTAIDMAGKVRDTLRIPNRLPAQTPVAGSTSAPVTDSNSKKQTSELPKANQ
jgi:tetratricopeptide (TPR) repeat protein